MKTLTRAEWLALPSWRRADIDGHPILLSASGSQGGYEHVEIIYPVTPKK